MFQDGIDKPGLVSDTRHHDDNPAAQATFLWHVESLVSGMSEIGNPFMDLIGDLVVLDTIVVADCTIVESVNFVFRRGRSTMDPAFVLQFLQGEATRFAHDIRRHTLSP